MTGSEVNISVQAESDETRAVALADDADESACEQLTDVRISGGSNVHFPPQFSLDCQLLLTLNDGVVRAYSVTSGQLVHAIQATEPISSLAIDSRNARQISTCDQSGTFTLWDLPLTTSLRKLTLNVGGDTQRLEGFHHVTEDGQLFVLVGRRGRKFRDSRVASLVHFNISSTGKRQVNKSSAVIDGVRATGERLWSVALGHQDRLVAAVTGVGCHNVTVCNIFKLGASNRHVLQHLHGDRRRRFTCLSVHPARPVLAVGDTTGRIILWRNLLADSPPVKSVLHWHTLSLPSVCFSPMDGSQLYSAGGECVLVTWSLRREGDPPEFLPRLGMPLCHVVAPRMSKQGPGCAVTSSSQVDAARLLAVAHEDNVIRVIDVERRCVTQIIRELVQCTPMAERFIPIDTFLLNLKYHGIGLAHDPRTDALVLNAASGQIQFYCPRRKRELFTVDITQTNYVSRERETTPSRSDVTHVAFTGDRCWMVTMEAVVSDAEKKSTLAIDDSRLKFWRYDEVAQQYALNTCVDDPHDGRVTALVASTAGTAASLVVTGGTDGAVKLWRTVDDSNIYQKGSRQCWCLSGSVTHRNGPVGCAGLSPDGTLLAAGIRSSIVVWSVLETGNPVRKGVLCYADSWDDVLQVEFAGCETPGSRVPRALASRSKSRLCFWNLTSMNLLHRLDGMFSCIAVNPSVPHFVATFHKLGESLKMVVHNIKDDRIDVHATCEVDAKWALSARFVADPNLPVAGDDSDWQSGCRLYYLTDQMSVHAQLPKRCRNALLSTSDLLKLTTTSSATTAFSALVAQKRRHGLPKKSSGQLEAGPATHSQVMEGLDEVLDVLDAPSHTLPDLVPLCLAAMEAMLPCRSSTDAASSDYCRKPNGSSIVDTSEDTPLPFATSTMSSDVASSQLDKLLSTDFSWLMY